MGSSAYLGIPDRYQWTHQKQPQGPDDPRQLEPLVMLNSDLSLVRDFTDYLQGSGEVSCQFRCRNQDSVKCETEPTVCPYAAETFDLMVEYKFDGSQWLVDFRDAFSRMLTNGYDTSSGCNDAPCMLN